MPGAAWSEASIASGFSYRLCGRLEGGRLSEPAEATSVGSVPPSYEVACQPGSV
jgi:hypothetical protein